jgi:para-nitrobenzyl esterase
VNELFDDIEFTRGDRAFALALADDHGGRRPVYKYRFTHTMTNDPELLVAGAYHGVELSFVLGMVDAGWVADFGDYTPTAAELELSAAIQGYWARFAATGDPNGEGAVEWPRFKHSSENYLILDQPVAADARFNTRQLDLLMEFNTHI